MEIDENEQLTSGSNLSDNGSDSDQTDEHENLQAELSETISSLLEQLTDNVYQYSVHVQYIQALRRAALFEELRGAREMMHRIFPLSEEMWLEWIEDESRLAVTKEEKQSVINLYSEAVKDYLSINIWSFYTNYVLNEYNDSHCQMEGMDNDSVFITLEHVRKVFKEACEETGYFVPESHKIWDPYRDFEEKILELSPSDEQKNRVKEMYLDRLKIPHSTFEKTFADYSSFITKYDNSNYERCMIEANAFFSETKIKYYEMDRYEQELNTSSFALEKFIKYIDNEIKQPNPLLPAIRTLYERAITLYYLDPSLWERYIFFLIEKKISYDDLLKICERSVRNCPWSGDLWSHYMRTMERGTVPNSYDEIKNIYQRALSTGMLNNNVDDLVKVIIANCDLERRTISNEGPTNLTNSDALKSIIAEGLQTVKKAFKNGDPLCRLEKYLIEIETITGNVNKAREVWERVIKRHHKESEVWLRYADWERSLGNIDEARKKYRKASQQDTDWPEQIFNAWEQFEHHYGTLEGLELAYIFIGKQMEYVKKKRAKALEEAQKVQYEQFQAEQTASVAEDPNLASEQNLLATDSRSDVKKRKYEEDDEQIEGSPFEKRNKSTHADRNKRDREFSTIVVRNLPLDTTKGQLKALFHECGKIVEIRLIEDPEKTHKYAYIEFAQREDVPVALTKDKKKVGENEIDVYRVFQHVLYVTNFTESTNLNELFKKYGEIIEVRVPSKTWRAGRFCYIEYKNRESAQAAVSEMNGYEIEPGRKLNVMISNPSLKKTRSPPMQKEVFVRNLPSRVEVSELEAFFNACGKVVKVRIPKTKDNRCKGIAFVEFDTEEHAKAAIALNSTEFKGCILNVSLSDVSRNDGQKRQPESESSVNATKKNTERINSVIISQLPPNATKKMIHGMILTKFQEDAIQDITLMSLENRAIVKFVRVEDAGKAILLFNKYNLNDRTINVTAEEEMTRVVQEGADPLSMVPRKIHKPSTNKKVKLEQKKRVKLEQKPQASNKNFDDHKNTGEGKKSNAYFRTMFLKGKGNAE
ncbi:8945_t:CDS:10 [Acaulospora morrowiae]|uniref:8945_t:CDS:1 n=1 Tax=Acaulospora morrowiae TaxID=94023 RepID=A0A9N9BMJ6_9GLOM|nr:8945_t:CDS:10 [Acaulospora morrowiae]